MRPHSKNVPTYVNADAVKTLAKALLEIADVYPLQVRTERDFFPLVLAYLHGRFPKTSTEHSVSHQKIDFRIGGSNPALLELAVAPRALTDKYQPKLKIPGHGAASHLYAANNKSEIKKLAMVMSPKAKARYLLLLDLQGRLDFETLRSGYAAALPSNGKGAPITIVYASVTEKVVRSFTVGGKRRGKKKPKAA